MKPIVGVVIAAIATALGCSGAPEADSTSESSAALGAERGGEGRDVTVMTRNVYLGFDIAPILAAPTPEDVPVLVAEGWAQMLANDFVARAGAIAKEIDGRHPALVGLEEVGTFLRTPHDGGPVQVIDYLKILRRALAARGLAYDVVIVQPDSDVTAPMFAGLDAQGAPLLDLVEMRDRDVILARADVKTSRATAARYAQGLPVKLAGVDLEIVRGWASVVARVDHGPAFRFVATHLEEDFAREVQLAQAGELLTMLEDERLPVVLTGDFNSAADGSQTPTYGMVRASGFVDAWAIAHPRAPGYTCCRPADLHLTAPLDQRIDFVFVREPCERHLDARAWIVGDEPHDRTRSGLWPSDHAGVVASFGIDGERNRW